MTVPGNPTNPEPNTGEPSSSAHTSGTAPAPETWRAGQHSRFAGRSAEEILGIAEALADVAQKFNQPVAPPAPPSNRFDLDIQDDEYLTGREAKRILGQIQSQQPQVDPVAAARNAKTAWSLAEMKWADEYRRWKAEIWQEAQKLPIHMWDVDNLGYIVDIVRGRHVDELAAEKAQRLVNESHPTIRSGTGGSGSVPSTHQSALEKGDPAMLARMRAVGITSEAELQEACKGTGIEPEQFLKELEKGAIIRG